MKEKVAVLIQKQVATYSVATCCVYKRGMNYLLKRSRKVFIMSCVIVSRS